jgi:hypothetical protein
MPDSNPVHKKRRYHNDHDQAKAQVELAANGFVHAHISNLYGCFILAQLVFSLCRVTNFANLQTCQLQDTASPGRKNESS